jgi:uncharacterized protein YbaR (Trm112 family)
MVIPRESPITSLKRSATTIADEIMPSVARQLITKARRQKRAPARKVRLESILACPACLGDVKVLRDAVKCEGCGRVYPIERGFPMMLLDQDLRHRPEAEPVLSAEGGR